MINAVLFDMDGVLLNTERLYYQTVSGITRELGYDMSMDFFIGTLGVPNQACRTMYRKTYGNNFPYEVLSKRLFSSVRQYVLEHGTPLKSGAVEGLTALKARGLRLVLATSCPRSAVEDFFLTLPELAPLLDDKVCGDEVSHGKPHPEIFLKAARLAGVDPTECLGVEDAASGLQAIHAAGAYAVMIPDMLPYTEELAPYADSVLESLHELPALIDRLNKIDR